MFAKKLTKGDTIGILSLAGCVEGDYPYENIEKFFDAHGFKVKFSKNILDKKLYLAGDDDSRVSAFEDFFEDNDVSAILSSRGGYGTLRLLDKIDYDLISQNPKILCGYSDITNLLNVIWAKTGLVTYHGPLAVSDFGADKVCSKTAKFFFDVLQGHMPVEYEANSDFLCLKAGMAKGILLGGNLTTLLSLIGTPYEIDFAGKILLLEDVCEPLYKIDRMLTQLRLCGVFDKVAGVVIAKFSATDVDDCTLKDFLCEFFSQIEVPSFYGFDASHDAPRYTLTIGAKHCLDSKKGKIIFEGQ